jgi:hypothetical protein
MNSFHAKAQRRKEAQMGLTELSELNFVNSENSVFGCLGKLGVSAV